LGLTIEELYADRLAEFYETLAHHFERGEDWERALAYHERAADKAAENFANRAVIAHCRQALAIADRLGARVADERRARLEERIGAASFYVSEFAASADAYERAAERSAEPARRAGNSAHAALSALWAHEYPRMEAAANAAVDGARRHALPAVEALATSIRGWQVGICRGDPEWQQAVRDALLLAERAGDEGALAMVRLVLTMHA